MSDPFEDATQTGNTATATAERNSNAVPAGTLNNSDDPFATTSEYKGTGGQWDPRVPFDEIEGRLIVMKPVSFDEKANKPEAFRQGPDDTTREEYRVELWVLDGPAFDFTYNAQDPNNPTEKIEKTQHVDPSAGTEVGDVKVPGARFRSRSIPQGQLIGALKGVDKDGRLLIGVMSRMPTVPDARKGVTPEDIKTDRAKWLAGGAKGNTKYRSTWSLDDRAHVLTPDLRAIAGAWWAQYRKTV